MRNITSWSRLVLPAMAAASLGLVACDDGVEIVAQQAVLEVDDQLDFGQVQIGTTTSDRIFIKNSGDGVLRLNRPSRGNPWSDAFTFDIEEASLIVAPDATVAVDVVFSPVDEGEAIALLEIRPDDASLDPVTVTIRGEGVSTTLNANPENLSFGNVVVNTTKTLTIDLSNDSNLDATVQFLPDQNVKDCTTNQQDPSTFCIRLRDRQITNGTFTLGAGESTVVEVQFTPVIPGTRERGNFSLRSCESSACETEIRVDGLGIESGFRCMPAELNFGQVNPGSCLTQTVSCENIANEQVTVVSWATVTNGGSVSSPDFEVEAPSVQVLNEGDSVDVDVTYCPETLGDDTGTLGIETDNQNPTLRNIFVPLQGTGGGPDIEVLPLQVNFGLVSTLAPARRSVLVTNVGFDALQINGVTMDTQGTGAYSSPDAQPGVLQPGEAMTITVEFQPQVEGAVDSSMIIATNDADEPEVEVQLIGEGIMLPPCNFEVVPQSLSFGVIEATRSVQRAFEIRNVGVDQCLVTAVRMTPGSDAAFSLPDGDIMSQLIDGGASTTITVQYSPTQSGTNTGGVEFSISSPSSPFNTVDLSGTGADSTLLIVPNEIDFGTIGFGCAARARIVTIYNTGATAATIDSIALSAPANPAFMITQLPAGLPGGQVTLAPGASTEFAVSFRAGQAESSYASAVEIGGSFNGQQVTYIVSLFGRAAKDATQIDEFEQLGTPKVDILFVIDNSCSMGQEQDSIAANFQAFIQFAQAQALDYQLGVTTADSDTDMGRLVHPTGPSALYGGPVQNKIVTPQTQPTPESVFVTNVSLGTGAPGSAADESGFESAFLALTAPNSIGHNAGFLRQDAVLSIIFVSDEPEQSQNTADFYINFFLSIKGFRNSNLFSASSIVGDNPGGCNGAGGSASAAPRYIEAANRTGGVFQSICTSDWSRALEDLSTAAFGFKSRFFLTNQPVISTIEIFIDGVSIPATSMGGTVNWSYDFATNSVNFSPFATPEPGAAVRIEYTAECL